jgi:hypothetical protein
MTSANWQRRRASQLAAAGKGTAEIAAALGIGYGAARRLLVALPLEANAGAGWRSPNAAPPSGRPLEADVAPERLLAAPHDPRPVDEVLAPLADPAAERQAQALAASVDDPAIGRLPVRAKDRTVFHRALVLAAPELADLVVGVRRSAASCRASSVEVEAAVAKLRGARFRVVRIGEGFLLNGSGARYSGDELVARAGRL